MPMAPGHIRDAIVGYLSALSADASIGEIQAAVTTRIGTVPASSVRSYLNLNVPDVFIRTAKGRYQLNRGGSGQAKSTAAVPEPVLREGKADLYHADCFDWLAQREASSIHAVVTDPSYGLVKILGEGAGQAPQRKGRRLAYSTLLRRA